MSQEAIIGLCSIAATLGVGGILRAQIVSQKDILKNYKHYIEALDVAKLKEFVDVADQMNEKKLELEKMKYEVEKDKDNQRFKEHYSKYATELANYVVFSMNGLKIPRDEKLRLTAGAFPLTFPLIKDRIL